MLKLAQRVERPLDTEVLVSCKAGRSAQYFETPCAIAQPADNSLHYAKDGLAIGLPLVQSDSGTHHKTVMNLSDRPHTLYEGAWSTL